MSLFGNISDGVTTYVNYGS